MDDSKFSSITYHAYIPSRSNTSPVLVEPVLYNAVVHSISTVNFGIIAISIQRKRQVPQNTGFESRHIKRAITYSFYILIKYSTRTLKFRFFLLFIHTRKHLFRIKTNMKVNTNVLKIVDIVVFIECCILSLSGARQIKKCTKWSIDRNAMNMFFT